MKTQNFQKSDIEHVSLSSVPEGSTGFHRPGAATASITRGASDASPSLSSVPQVPEFSPIKKNDPTEISLPGEPPSPYPTTFTDLVFRDGSLLARITQDQRTQLFQWLTEYSVADVLDFVAAPAPQGFGLQTHQTTLRRIKAFLRSTSARTAYESSSAGAELLAETIRENRPQFAPVISELLLQKAFDLANNQEKTHELKDLISSAIKLRELDLKVQRLQFLREKANSPTPRPRIRVKSSPQQHMNGA